jgi:amino acid transporter
MGLSWVGTAAKLGSSHVVFWLLAVVLFYVPSAVVVVHLSRKMPLEGGLYQWAKLGISDRMGFLTAWNLWIYAMVLMSENGVTAATNIAYAFHEDWIAENKWCITLATLVIIGGLAWLSVVGLGAGKWLHGGAGLMMVIIVGAMIALPIVPWLHGVKPQSTPFALTMPALTVLNLNILGKLGFGALGGVEYVAIFAGETRDPARLIARSVYIAAPVIAVLFILGTGAVLVFIPQNQIDLVSPVSQVLSVATQPFGIAASVAGAIIMAVLGLRIAQTSVNFAATARLPMVAGWDHLLPKWFTKLHPKYRTPVLSIAFVGAVTMLLGIAGIAGIGRAEAFQLLNNASGIFYALTYLVLFAIPILGSTGASRGVKIASGSGFLMTLLYVVLSIFPIIEVKSRAVFTLKISVLVVVCNLIGVGIFEVAGRLRRGA